MEAQGEEIRRDHLQDSLEASIAWTGDQTEVASNSSPFSPQEICRDRIYWQVSPRVLEHFSRPLSYYTDLFDRDQ